MRGQIAIGSRALPPLPRAASRAPGHGAYLQVGPDRRLSAVPRQPVGDASASAGRELAEGQSPKRHGHRLLRQPGRAGDRSSTPTRARCSSSATSPTSSRRSRPAAAVTASRRRSSSRSPSSSVAGDRGHGPRLLRRLRRGADRPVPRAPSRRRRFHRRLGAPCSTAPRDEVRARASGTRRGGVPARWRRVRSDSSLANLRTFPWVAEREKAGTPDAARRAISRLRDGELYLLDEAEDVFRPV